MVSLVAAGEQRTNRVGCVRVERCCEGFYQFVGVSERIGSAVVGLGECRSLVFIRPRQPLTNILGPDLSSR